MPVIALTGGIGSGKTEATKIFANLGVPVVDVDLISHKLTNQQAVLDKIAAVFGDTILNQDKSLDRAALRKIIFSKDSCRKELESILHPLIFDAALLELSANSKTPYQILSIPLLDENSRYLNYIDKILVIDCDETLQLSRTMKRSNLSLSEAKAIIAAQISKERRLAMADDIIENNGSLEDLSNKINDFHRKYINTCIVSD